MSNNVDKIMSSSDSDSEESLPERYPRYDSERISYIMCSESEYESKKKWPSVIDMIRTLHMWRNTLYKLEHPDAYEGLREYNRHGILFYGYIDGRRYSRVNLRSNIAMFEKRLTQHHNDEYQEIIKNPQQYEIEPLLGQGAILVSVTLPSGSILTAPRLESPTFTSELINEEIPDNKCKYICGTILLKTSLARHLKTSKHALMLRDKSKD
jgi:hypothetical protein